MNVNHSIWNIWESHSVIPQVYVCRSELVDEQAWTGNVVYNLSLPASVYILVTIVIAL